MTVVLARIVLVGEGVEMNCCIVLHLIGFGVPCRWAVCLGRAKCGGLIGALADCLYFGRAVACSGLACALLGGCGSIGCVGALSAVVVISFCPFRMRSSMSD